MEGKEIILYDICLKNIRKPVQCLHCLKIFCYECIKNYYQNEKKYHCYNCQVNQRLDEYQYRLDLLSFNSYQSIVQYNEGNNINNNNNKENNYNNDIIYFCVECFLKFEEKEKPKHSDHHFYDYKIIKDLNLETTLLKELNESINFQKKIDNKHLECLKDILIIKSMKKIKLEEIDSLKIKIISFFEKKEELLTNYNIELKNILNNYNKIINKNFIKLTEIIENNSKNLIKKRFQKLKDFNLNSFQNQNKMDEKINNLSPSKHSFIFESYEGEKLEYNEKNWDNKRSIKIITNQSNEKYDSKLLIFLNNENKFNIIIQLIIDSKYKNAFYSVHLQMINNKNNRSLEIPVEFYERNLTQNKSKYLLKFQRIFEDNEEIDSFLENEPKLKIFVSKLELS
jgi:hypothetical protein